MTIPKHAKAISLNHLNSKFGDGVILEPIRMANDPYAGGGCACVGGPKGSCATCSTIKTCGQAGGCGSSNKIKVYR